jgi:4-hydroxybenzoate polyprenyltransferase
MNMEIRTKFEPSTAPSTIQTSEPAICVDLDGTLVRTNLLLETFLAAVRRNPMVLFLAALWLWRGKPVLKQNLAACVTLDPALLPYNEPLIHYLRARKQAGAKLYLTTAADRRAAQSVADHLGLFDAVLASDGSTNLKGDRKRQAIQALLPAQPFLYAGDAPADLAIWKASAGAIAVNAPPRVKAALDRENVPTVAAFDAPASRLKSTIKALRVYQWSKNVLVFVPILLGHALNLAHAIPATLAFFAFSLCASAFYVVNDLLDLEADRAHPRKRARPFASGALPISDGLLMLAALVPAILLLNLWLSPAARWLLAGYAAVNLAYSVQLKRVLFLDVLVLACLYALRVLYGAAATAITVSIWTLAFSIFLFLGLALVKRLTELRRIKAQRGSSVARRAYLPVDISMLRAFASTSLYLSVLVMALYINSADVWKLYHRPEALWFVCLLLIYWVSRMLMLANRGALTDDPIVFAFRDRPSRVVAILLTGCVVLAL